MQRDERPIVYSSTWEENPVCPRCGKNPCVCQQKISLPPPRQTLTIRREVKGRGGKTVTTISNIILSEQDIKHLAKSLKKVCGTGGTVKLQTIEIQGDFREKIAVYLQKQGYKIKFSGG
jgi:translation initiation factor 1